MDKLHCVNVTVWGRGGEVARGGHNVGKLSECLAVYVDTNSSSVGRQGGGGQKNVLLTSLFGPCLPPYPGFLGLVVSV